MKLSDRITAYIAAASQKLLPKLPIIIVVNGVGFNKLTALIDKPFSTQLAKSLLGTLMHTVKEVEGAVFGYQYNDELIILTRNDQTVDTQPWYNNDAQTLASVASSIATCYFNDLIDGDSENLGIDDAVFRAKVFAVPSMSEAINALVYKQQQAFQTSVSHACLYELLKKGKNKMEIQDLLSNTTTEDKISLLSQECEVEYHTAYPQVFRRGAACYRQPKLVEYQGKESVKMSWGFDTDLPIFTTNQSFLIDIINR